MTPVSVTTSVVTSSTPVVTATGSVVPSLIVTCSYVVVVDNNYGNVDADDDVKDNY